jgi:hypothetical protein
MTDFKTQASALLESLETQSKQTQNFAQLELLILKTTQKLGQIAAQTLLDHKTHLRAWSLEPNASEGLPPSEPQMSPMPDEHEQKRNPHGEPENPLG